MVRVRVAAVLVIGRHDVRAELAHQPDQRRRRDLHRLQGEAAIGQRGQRVSLGQAGVDEAQPAVLHPEDAHRLGHLLASVADDVPDHLGVVGEVGVEHVTALTAGAADDHDVDALGDVSGHGGGALARLVVGMGVHGHEPQGLTHAGSSP